MTLIVEDGSALAGAESYVTLTEADEYFALRGFSVWETLTVDQKEQAIRRATDFMVARYRAAWKGYRALPTQALDWPRIGVVINEGRWSVPVGDSVVPAEVKKANCELAIRAASGPLVEDITERIVQEVVGPITTKYDQYAPTQVQYVQVDMILKPFLSLGGSDNMIKLRRC